jgi:hypothetical protein
MDRIDMFFCSRCRCEGRAGRMFGKEQSMWTFCRISMFFRGTEAEDICCSNTFFVIIKV